MLQSDTSGKNSMSPFESIYFMPVTIGVILTVIGTLVCVFNRPWQIGFLRLPVTGLLLSFSPAFNNPVYMLITAIMFVWLIVSLFKAVNTVE
ncbi:hypothetical protein [Maritalea sp.]|uniref:hypothetical protein n=1 Tax=Maritalea sp. TaxID=2003361 RepID=UPI003EF144E7